MFLKDNIWTMHTGFQVLLYGVYHDVFLSNAPGVNCQQLMCKIKCFNSWMWNNNNRLNFFFIYCLFSVLYAMLITLAILKETVTYTVDVLKYCLNVRNEMRCNSDQNPLLNTIFDSFAKLKTFGIRFQSCLSRTKELLSKSRSIMKNMRNHWNNRWIQQTVLWK